MTDADARDLMRECSWIGTRVWRRWGRPAGHDGLDDARAGAILRATIATLANHDGFADGQFIAYIRRAAWSGATLEMIYERKRSWPVRARFNEAIEPIQRRAAEGKILAERLLQLVGVDAEAAKMLFVDGLSTRQAAPRLGVTQQCVSLRARSALKTMTNDVRWQKQ